MTAIALSSRYTNNARSGNARSGSLDITLQEFQITSNQLTAILPWMEKCPKDGYNRVLGRFSRHKALKKSMFLIFCSGYKHTFNDLYRTLEIIGMLRLPYQ